MKKLLTSILLATSLSSYSFANICENTNVEGNYEYRLPTGDVEYSENVNFEEILQNFVLSMFTFSLSKKDDNTYAFKSNGLTEMGQGLLDTDAAGFLGYVASLEGFSYVVKEVKGQCSIVSNHDDRISITSVDPKSGTLFDLDTEEGVSFIVSISKKL